MTTPKPPPHAVLTIDSASVDGPATLSGTRHDQRWAEEHKYQEVVVMTLADFKRLTGAS